MTTTTTTTIIIEFLLITPPTVDPSPEHCRTEQMMAKANKKLREFQYNPTLVLIAYTRARVCACVHTYTHVRVLI